MFFQAVLEKKFFFVVLQSFILKFIQRTDSPKGLKKFRQKGRSPQRFCFSSEISLLCITAGHILTGNHPKIQVLLHNPRPSTPLFSASSVPLSFSSVHLHSQTLQFLSEKKIFSIASRFYGVVLGHHERKKNN